MKNNEKEEELQYKARSIREQSGRKCLRER